MKCTVLALTVLATLARAEWKPDPLCPYPSNEVTRTPYNGDCSKYWECYQGTRYTMACPSGQEYNSKGAKCDAPEIAKCSKDNNNNNSNDNSDDGGKDSNWKPDPLCPYPSDKLTFLAHKDCTKFYECWQGNKYELNCPANLYWNTKQNYCDYLENVDCSKNDDSNPDKPVDPKPDKPVDPVDPADPGKDGKWQPDPLCPYPSEELTFYPHKDCTKFYECWQGNKYVFNCPANLYWNTKHNYCDYLANVDCSINDGSAPDTPDTPVDPVKPSDPDSNKTDNSNGKPDAMCASSSSVITFYSNPKDCSKYIECYRGLKYDMSCPADLYWNNAKRTCDYKKNVVCSGDNTNPDTPVDPVKPSDPSDSDDNKGGDLQPDPLCPYPSDVITFYPNPNDCGKYYECHRGIKYVMSCPAKLYWNDAKRTCDYQSSVVCQRDPNPNPDPDPKPDPKPDPQPDPVPISPSKACENQVDGTYLANPSDCHKLYECLSGKAIDITCAGDLYWHQEIHSCDYKSNVKCAAA